ncbi:type II secretion system minor pseudopilin GspJ [Sansalvadorimonas verongulae]|uniref:type II secretion system minor pseudopilin GspJ n=1 Tax=Sansalvadorimonas verongulae TaxID=2172824 RepID=UPI0012BD7E6F|nr:type II secretion system minor pseudopilin GspJ [Sansalvadorimonas verongulae]MTI14333.1 type II secretion system protein GspJ [Sansalvadorimonas verongulae]
MSHFSSCISNAKRQSRKSGFTLLELLIAIAIFSLLAAGCYRLFKSVSSTHEVTLALFEQSSEMQRALAILNTDLSQMAMRPIRNEFGDYEAAVTTNAQNALVTFTRHGWRNYTNAKRSELQRVSYAYDGGRLLRRYWETLDRAPDTPYREQVLLDNIQGFSLRFRDNKKRWHSSWPPASDKQSERLKMVPAAVEYTILHPRLGSVQQFLAGVSFRENEKKVSLPQYPAGNSGEGSQTQPDGGQATPFGNGSIISVPLYPEDD